MNYKIIVSSIFFFIIYRVLYKKNSKIYDYDIIIEPGGNYGFYTLGICHFIKNNYNIKDKKIIGFSAGSWNVIFLSIINKIENNNYKDNIYLLSLFKNNIMCNDNMAKNLLLLKNNINNNICFNNLELNNKSIGITNNLNKLYEINYFISMKDLINSCITSSFLPYITMDKFFQFYRGKVGLDGGLYYYIFIKENTKYNCLTISYDMFGRYPTKIIPGITNINISGYELYMIGYHDALKNKIILDKYLL